jgi:hypothetical protein
VPTPTPDEIRDAAAEVAAGGVQSATTGDQTTNLMDPLKQIKAADALESRDLLETTNPQGGPRSPWGMLRPAQATLPGAQ